MITVNNNNIFFNIRQVLNQNILMHRYFFSVSFTLRFILLPQFQSQIIGFYNKTMCSRSSKALKLILNPKC